MSFDRHQIRDFVKRSLARRKLDSPSAINLLLGTMAQESAFGTFLRQMGSGPALGAYQMERPTFAWVRNQWISRMPELGGIKFEDLEGNLDAATLLCRLRYRLVQTPLPDAHEIHDLAAYWKQWWNSELGAGTVEQFEANYKKYVIET